MTTSFGQIFPLTNKQEGDLPLCLRQTIIGSVGVYGNGLLTVFNNTTSAQISRSLGTLIGESSVPVMSTAMGNIFFWDERGISFLETQRGTSELIDDDVNWALTEFFVQDDVLRDVFHRERCEELVATHGCFTYGQAFILSPWELLGGTPILENYTCGDLVVYLDMVSQFLGKAGDIQN